MSTLKNLGRRGLAMLLTFVMCMGMVNLSAFASEEERNFDENFQLPNPLEISMQIEALNEEIDGLDPEAEDYEAQLAELQGQLAALEMLQYPMEDSVLLAMDGREYENFGEFLFGVHPKNGLTQLPEGGVWSAEGKWEEDNSDVLVMDENGHATINEPKGPQAQVTVKYTYTHEVEVTAPVENEAPKAEQTPAPEITAPAEGENKTEPAEGEQKDEENKTPETTEPEGEEGEADGTPSEENNGETQPETNPGQEPAEDEEGTDLTEQPEGSEAQQPETTPVEADTTGTTQVQGEGNTETPEEAEGKNGEEGEQGEEGTQPESQPEPTPADPAQEENTDESNESAPATTTQEVEEVLTWTVVFTSEVEPLAGDDIANWANLQNKLKTAGTYKLTKDIAVEGTVTVNQNVTLNLNGKTLSYKGDIKGNMFEVTGGTFTITGTGTIQGTGTAKKGNTGSLVLVNGGTFKLQGGTLTGNRKGSPLSKTHIYNNSTTDASNGNTKGFLKVVDQKTGRTVQDGYVGAGVYVKSGTFEMTGGAITNNHTIYTEAQESAAGAYQVISDLRPYYVLAYNGSDYVANSAGTYRYDNPVGQGGGVYVSENGTFKMSGTASISNNHAGEGGGVYVTQKGSGNNQRNGLFTMSGGSVSGNIAHLGEGGGIYIQSNNAGNLISGGSITNNETHTTEDLGGGGIYVENSSQLHLTNALITENNAQGLGGGIAACIHGKIASFALNGAAVYNNHAMTPNTGAGFVKSISMKYYSMMQNHTGSNGTWLTYDQYRNAVISSGYHTFIDSYHLWEKDTNFQKKAQDIFSAGSDTQSNGGAIVSNQMLGGLANWSGYARTGDKTTEIKESNNDVVKAGTLLALTAAPDPMPTKKADVTISGNKSTKTHGGGLATNGLVLIGTEGEESPNPVKLEISKTFDGSEKQFTFGLFAEDGTTPIKNGNKDVTATLKASSSKDGKATLTIPASAFTAAEGSTNDYTFKVKEINTSTTDGIDYDTNAYTVVVTVKTTIKTQNLGGAPYKVTTREAHLKSVSPAVTDNVLTFNNHVKRGSLVLNKNLVNPVSTEADSWTFHVKLEGGSGVYGENTNFTEGDITVTSKKNEIITNIPVGTKYTVTEANKDETRYVTSGEVTEAQTIVEGNNSVTIKNERLYGNLTVKKLVHVNTPSSEAAPNDNFYIVVKLGEGNVEVEKDVKTYVANGRYVFELKDNSEATITGIPTGTTYTVEEYADAALKQQMPAYEIGKIGYSGKVVDPNSGVVGTTNGTVEVQNHYYQPKFTTETVTKTWGVPDTILTGESITVQLYQKDTVTGESKEYGSAVTLNKETVNKDGAWIYTWNDLPEYTGDNGHQYTYYVEEVSINYGDLKAEVEAYLTKVGKTDKKLREENPIVRDEKDHTLFRIYGSDFNAETGEYEILGGFRADINGFNIKNNWIPAEDIGDGEFELVKVENLDDASQKYLSGATFTLAKENGEVISEQTTAITDANPTGKLTFSGLREGKYILTETKAPEGYQGFEKPWTVTVTASLVKVEGNETVNDKDGWQNRWEFTASGNDIDNNVMTVENKFVTGKISIDKTLVLDGVIDDIPEGFTEKIFEFSIYPGQYAGKEIPEDVKPIDTLKVQGDGKTTDTSIDLRYGWYTLRETVTAELPDYIHAGTEFNIYDEDGDPSSEINQIEIFIGEQGKVHEVHAANHYVHDTGSLSVSKAVVGVPASDAFEFEVKLTLPQDYVAAGMMPEDGKFTLPVSGGVEQKEIEFTLNDLTATGTVKVADGQKAVIEGIPTGTVYAVEEKNAGSYRVEMLNNTEDSTIVKGGSHQVAFTNTQWIGASANLNVRKVLSYQDVDMSLVNREFTFELHELTVDDANQVTKDETIGTLTLGGSENNLTPSSTFPLVYSFEKDGLVNGKGKTFIYEIREVPNDGQSYLWAPSVGVKVTVSVKDGQYKVDSIVYGNDEALKEAVFNNKIDTSKDTEGKIVLGGMKNLNGTPSDRAFRFTLTDVTDPENPVDVETVSNTTSTEENNRGQIKFAEIDLTASGMTAEKYQVKNSRGEVEGYRYIYEIREVSEGAGNLFIDKTVYTVTVDVKDDNGLMKVQKYTFTVPGEGEDAEPVTVNSIVFNNILTPPPVTPPTTPDRPVTPPDEPVPDPDVPLTPGPEPTPEQPTPEEEFPGDDVPLAPAPETPEEVFDEDVPLATMPPEEEEVFDEDVPLATVPKTGDSTGLWAGLTALSGLSLAALGFTGKRKEDDDQQA